MEHHLVVAAFARQRVRIGETCPLGERESRVAAGARATEAGDAPTLRPATANENETAHERAHAPGCVGWQEERQRHSDGGSGQPDRCAAKTPGLRANEDVQRCGSRIGAENPELGARSGPDRGAPRMLG